MKKQIKKNNKKKTNNKRKRSRISTINKEVVNINHWD